VGRGVDRSRVCSGANDAFDWKEPVMVIGGGIAAGCTIFTTVATAPTWVPIGGAVAGGIAAATAISEWLDDDCYDCDGSGCNTCEPPDDDDCMGRT